MSEPLETLETADEAVEAAVLDVIAEDAVSEEPTPAPVDAPVAKAIDLPNSVLPYRANDSAGHVLETIVCDDMSFNERHQGAPLHMSLLLTTKSGTRRAHYVLEKTEDL